MTVNSASMIIGRYATPVLLALLVGVGGAQAQVLLPRTTQLNTAQPVFDVDPSTGLPLSPSTGNFSLAPTTTAAGATLDSHCTVACASVVVTGAHNFYGFNGSSTVAGWFLLFDAAACPADGTVTPYRTYAYPTIGTTIVATFGDIPKHLTTGVAMCFSTTGPFTKTASPTAEIGIDYQ